MLRRGQKVTKDASKGNLSKQPAAIDDDLVRWLNAKSPNRVSPPGGEPLSGKENDVVTRINSDAKRRLAVSSSLLALGSQSVARLNHSEEEEDDDQGGVDTSREESVEGSTMNQADSDDEVDDEQDNLSRDTMRYLSTEQKMVIIQGHLGK